MNQKCGQRKRVGVPNWKRVGVIGVWALALWSASPVWAQGKAGTATSKQIEVTAEKSAEFDTQGRVATFHGSVKLVDPQFTLNADMLVVEILKEGGIKRAEATGHVVIVTQQESKKTDDSAPSKSTAKAQKAIYNPTSGDVTLIGRPQIQQGINLHIATSDGTRMTLNRAGGMTTEGPSKTLIQEGDAAK